jgi:hypothetical protein
MSKVLTDYSYMSDSELEVFSLGVYKSCNGNANFTFAGGENTKLGNYQTDYNNKLSVSHSGGPSAVMAKDEARGLVIGQLRIVSIIVNLQAAGDSKKLESSGLIISKDKEFAEMPVAHGFSVKLLEVSGSVKLAVDKPAVHDHGTMFAFTPAQGASNNINNWRIVHANGHSTQIDDLTSGTVYSFSAAYKGRDGEKLKWCDVISKMIA